MTPMMEQYFEIKNNYKDYILFYRLGDFYEMFFDDARIAADVLDLALTGKDCGEEERAPMCGVPYHSVDFYIGKMIESGYKIAICEQLEDPATAKGIVKRGVIRVVTPGTLIESNLLEENKNNYIASAYFTKEGIGVCFADISTGEAFATSFVGTDAKQKLQNEISTFRPSEMLINIKTNDEPQLIDLIHSRLGTMIDDNQAIRFDYKEAYTMSKESFPENFDDFSANSLIICSVGALLSYLYDVSKSNEANLHKIKIYSSSQYMDIDVNSRRNLELTETMRSKERKGSLLWVLDKTKTAAGARMLKQWVEHPLLNVKEIRARQTAINELYSDFSKRQELIDLLTPVLDLERLITKCIYKTANAKDLRSICTTISQFPLIKHILAESESDKLRNIYKSFDTLDDIKNLIDTSIVEDPPFSVREGNMIKDEFNAEVDDLRLIIKDGRRFVDEIENREREATGIKTLRINDNKVFGYYIEVTKSLVSQVPDRYIRKQTLSNCERYITEELKQLEAKIFGASDKICAIEYNIFSSIRDAVASNAERIKNSASLVAEIDVYQSLATVAIKNRFIMPEVDESDILSIKNGRHPVVEQFVNDDCFVPNDVYLDTNANRLMLITGPNMAGKSTFMRQVALITVMAQIGSFVPAEDSRIGIVDKVFTRVGASDDLASGQSTFMLEMNEVSYILKTATKKSLIIYDEVGRGTSTFDGMSIARAIIEYTVGKKIGAKTLFATHYHELTSMENEYDGIVNYNIAAKKRGDDILFLRKIIRGSTDDSYGIEVAKLAGLPNEVIKRAKEILSTVEKSSRNMTTSNSLSLEEAEDLITIEDMTENSVIEDIKKIDVNSITPMEALKMLSELSDRLK